MDRDSFNQGVESAYIEMQAAIDSDDHPCTCRPCQVMRTTLEKLVSFAFGS